VKRAKRSNVATDASKREAEEPASGLTIAAMVVALIVAFAFLPRFFGSRGGGPLSGKPAPEVTFNYVLNAPAAAPSLSSLKGHPVLLDFWATWCGPCQQTAPVVDRIAARYRDQGLAVVGVNTSDEAGNAAPWASRHHLNYPIAFDSGEAARAYGVENLPTLVVIGKDGNVVAVHHGLTSDAELDDLVKKAL